MHSILFPFFVLFPLVKAVTTPANDKRLSLNATVSFGRFSAFSEESHSSQAAMMVDGHGLQIEGGRKRNVDAAKRKHFKGLAIFPDDPGIWPGGIVPYHYASFFNSTEKAVIKYAMDEFHKKTCITFRPRKYDDMYFLAISGHPKEWCSSHVGRDTEARTKDGKFMTNLNMDPECFDGPAMIHELMHSIGFHHEHHREDRDPRVTAGPRDPDPNQDFWNRAIFNRSKAYYMGEYDTESVMHYNFDWFKPYIREYFTQSDINNINILYKCSMNRNRINERNFAKKAKSNKRGRKNDAIRKYSAKNNINGTPRKFPGVQVSKTGKNAFISTNKHTKWIGAPTNAPRMSWSSTERYYSRNNAIRRSTGFGRNNMNAKNNLKGNFVRTGNTAWTKATRNPRNVAKINFVTWRPTSFSWGSNNLYGRYFAGNSAIRRYTPSTRNNMNNMFNRYFTGNNAVTKNIAFGNNYMTNRYPGNWGYNNHYGRYFGRNGVIGRTIPPTRNNVINRINPSINTKGWNRATLTNLKRNLRNSAGNNPGGWSSNNFNRRYFAGNYAIKNNKPLGRNNVNNRNTYPRYVMGRNNAAWTKPNRNPKAARRNSGMRSSNNLYGSYFAGSKVLRRDTPPLRSNLNARSPHRRNSAGTDSAAWTRANRYPKAAQKNPVMRSSNNLYGNYFAGSKVIRRDTPPLRSNLNARSPHRRNSAGTDSAAWTRANRYPKATGRNPARWSSNNFYTNYYARSNTTRNSRPFRKSNVNRRNNYKRNKTISNRTTTRRSPNHRNAAGRWFIGNRRNIKG